MKVLTVLNWLSRGGIETRLLLVAPELIRRGIQLNFCCLGGPGALDPKFQELGCRIFHFSQKEQRTNGYRAVREILQQERYDVVHSRYGYTSVGIARAARECKTPVIVSNHNTMKPAPILNGVSVARTAWRTALQWNVRRTIPLVEKYLAVSEACLDDALPEWRTCEAKCRVLHNGIQFPAEMPDRDAVRLSLGVEKEAPCLLHVGSFKHQKNHHGLLEIFRRVVERNPQVKLLLVGDGPLRESLQSETMAGPLRDSILFLGEQDDVWQFYSAADLFLFPSRYEGSPNALAEAIGSGMPIVASRISPHLEAVPPVLHSCLFDLPDYQQAANLVLEQLETNRFGKTAQVQESKQVVRDRFSLKRHVEELAGIYESLSGRSERRAA